MTFRHKIFIYNLARCEDARRMLERMKAHPDLDAVRDIIDDLRSKIAKVMTDDEWHPKPDDEAPEDWWPAPNFVPDASP